ncbi:MAG: hypothetical protein RL662_691 [Bacteroidota bacterium]|jgi:NAD(P)H-dependent FMN reductase
MKTIMSFGASNSSVSINQKLATYVSSKLTHHNVQLLTLTDYDIPMYSADLEKAKGIPADVRILYSTLELADALVVSVAEHNGNWAAFFKNIIDWLSRINVAFLEGKKILLLSASPGARGGASSLAIATQSFPVFKGEVVATYSLGKFYDRFEADTLTDADTKAALDTAIHTFLDSLQAID